MIGQLLTQVKNEAFNLTVAGVIAFIVVLLLVNVPIPICATASTGVRESLIVTATSPDSTSHSTVELSIIPCLHPAGETSKSMGAEEVNVNRALPLGILGHVRVLLPSAGTAKVCCPPGTQAYFGDAEGTALDAFPFVWSATYQQRKAISQSKMKSNTKKRAGLVLTSVNDIRSSSLRGA